MKIIDQMESDVRGYVRSFPAVFARAQNACLYDDQGREYIDFFAGAGTLNYGHNNLRVKQALLDYIQSDGLMHGLDLATPSKIAFLDAFQNIILKPRNFEYKIQFTGPTGTNAIEAAIKLARKAKARSHVIAFTNAYHGHSLGALSLTGNSRYHDEHYGSRNNVSHLPFDGYFGDKVDTAAHLRKLLTDKSSGLPLPAAIILETIQAEGGINVASDGWLQAVRDVCDEFDIVLIIDDIQVGNGRTGTFFSFESSGIKPDIICLSKAIGAGLPMSIVLISPELDVWQPGEHTGTFRGNQLAFVAAAAVLPLWQDDTFTHQLKRNVATVHSKLNEMTTIHSGVSIRGKGMIWGLCVADGETADDISRRCFDNGLMIETAGPEGQVVKFLAPLTTEHSVLCKGLDILQSALSDSLAAQGQTKVAL